MIHPQPGHRFGAVSQTEETKSRWQCARRHADRFAHGGFHDRFRQYYSAPDSLQKSKLFSIFSIGVIGTQTSYFQMEQLMDRMQDENTGIPVRTVNKFRAKVPSVFTGNFLTLSCYFTV